MRDIIFRGQTRRYGEKVMNMRGDPMPSKWAYGGVLQGSGDFSIIYGDSDNEKLKKWVVYSDTLGQYSGLHDGTKWDQLTEKEQGTWLKDHTREEWQGKPIFEGDIVEYNTYDDFDCYSVVRFGEYKQDGSNGEYSGRPCLGFSKVCSKFCQIVR